MKDPVTTEILTADDLLRMPTGYGDRYELVAGELRVMEPPGGVHGFVSVEFARELSNHVKSEKLGRVLVETGFILRRDPDTVRAPDVAFLRTERMHEIGEAWGYIPGAPDLVVEVLSPGDAYVEVEEKAMSWLAAGAFMVVVANPRSRTMTVYRPGPVISHLSEGDFLDGKDVVPGWRLRVGDVFD